MYRFLTRYIEGLKNTSMIYKRAVDSQMESINAFQKDSKRLRLALIIISVFVSFVKLRVYAVVTMA